MTFVTVVVVFFFRNQMNLTRQHLTFGVKSLALKENIPEGSSPLIALQLLLMDPATPLT